MIVYLICYLVSFFLALRGYYYLSGAALLLAAAWLYISDYRRFGNLVHLRGLFSLFWVGGQGLSCMKLSYLQVDWAGMTWFCLALAYAGFWLVFEVLSRLYGTGYDSHSRFRSFSCVPYDFYADHGVAFRLYYGGGNSGVYPAVFTGSASCLFGIPSHRSPLYHSFLRAGSVSYGALFPYGAKHQ